MSTSTLGNAAGPGVCKRGREVVGYKRQQTRTTKVDSCRVPTRAALFDLAGQRSGVRGTERLEQGPLLFPCREADFAEEREIPITADEFCPTKTVSVGKRGTAGVGIAVGSRRATGPTASWVLLLVQGIGREERLQQESEPSSPEESSCETAEKHSSPWRGLQQSRCAYSSLSWSSRGWRGCRLCWVPPAWAGCRCQDLEGEREESVCESSRERSSAWVGEKQPAKPAARSFKDVSPLSQHLRLLSHVACVGSSKPELLVLLWDGRSWCSGTSSKLVKRPSRPAV